jgi:hypothetical protein
VRCLALLYISICFAALEKVTIPESACSQNTGSDRGDSCGHDPVDIFADSSHEGGEPCLSMSRSHSNEKV